MTCCSSLDTLDVLLPIQVVVLLSLKAGLRAGEIAQLSWDMVRDPVHGEFANPRTNGSARAVL